MKQNGLCGFSERKQKAGYEWFYAFMKWNPDLHADDWLLVTYLCIHTTQQTANTGTDGKN